MMKVILAYSKPIFLIMQHFVVFSSLLFDGKLVGNKAHHLIFLVCIVLCSAKRHIRKMRTATAGVNSFPLRTHKALSVGVGGKRDDLRQTASSLDFFTIADVQANHVGGSSGKTKLAGVDARHEDIDLVD